MFCRAGAGVVRSEEARHHTARDACQHHNTVVHRRGSMIPRSTAQPPQPKSRRCYVANRRTEVREAWQNAQWSRSSVVYRTYGGAAAAPDAASLLTAVAQQASNRSRFRISRKSVAPEIKIPGGTKNARQYHITR